MTRYRDSLARTGWSLALGGAGVGAGAALVGLGSADVAVVALIGDGLVGAVLGSILIVGVGGPAWWLVQRQGWRGPWAAGTTGAAVAAGMTLLMLTLTPRRALSGALWASAGATALVAGFLGGLLALAMWLVRYRPR